MQLAKIGFMSFLLRYPIGITSLLVQIHFCSAHKQQKRPNRAPEACFFAGLSADLAFFDQRSIACALGPSPNG